MKSLVFPGYKAAFAAKLPVGGVVQCNPWIWRYELVKTERT